MSTFTKKLVSGIVGIGLMAIGALVGVVQEAKATAFSTNTATALTIRFTPNVDRGVEITSANVVLNLGTLAMNFSTYTVRPATVTIVGNMSSTELTMKSTVTAVTGTEASWTFDNDPASSEADNMGTWALFTATTTLAKPSDTDFEVSNATVTTGMVATAEQVGDSNSRFEINGGGVFADMDSMPANTPRHLWIKLRTPLNSSDNIGIQDVIFTLTSTTSN